MSVSNNNTADLKRVSEREVPSQRMSVMKRGEETSLAKYQQLSAVINWFLKIKDDGDGDRRVINKRSVDGRCSQDYRFTPFSSLQREKFEKESLFFC